MTTSLSYVSPIPKRTGQGMAYNPSRTGLCIALVSDFFYPSLGGVETHMLGLARQLVRNGHKVIVITHWVPGYDGVVEMDGFRVYYLPVTLLGKFNTVCPLILPEYLMGRKILLNQGVTLVHAHQSASALALEFVIFAKVLKIPAIMTQHSLYTSHELFDMHLNSFGRQFYPICDRIVCVSRATRNNLILRSGLAPSKATVIPVAVEMNSPTPKQSPGKEGIIKIAVVGRLVERRGIDILIDMLPSLFQTQKQVELHVVGDGPKMAPLRQAVIQNKLEGKVVLYGQKRHSQALAIMSCCHIYLNTAITQSFGIAVVEAAGSGLKCVSTNVGGLTETLPLEHLICAQPSSQHLLTALNSAIHEVREGSIISGKDLSKLYSQEKCTQCLLRTYEQVLEAPPPKRPTHVECFWRDGVLCKVLALLLVLLGLLESYFKKSRKYNS